MKIRRKLLISYLLIVALFVAAGATITYNTNKMADLQNTVKTQVEINNNAYAYQQGLDQKQFGTLMYCADKTADGERIIVQSADIMQPAETYLQAALASNPDLLAKFNEVVEIDRNAINAAITQVYAIYSGSGSSEKKYVDMWYELTQLMERVTLADGKLVEVRAATLASVQAATAEAQNYSSLSLIIAVVFLAVIVAVSVALSIVMGNRIITPLKKLADIAQKVSMGDLNQRYYLKQKIDIKTGDEIDELVEAFRRMVNAFRLNEALGQEAGAEQEKHTP